MIARALVSFDGTVRARSVIAVLEVVGTECVLEWSRFSEASGGHAEADVLSKNACCNANREWCHVRIDWHMTLPDTLDVIRIIEKPLPFKGD